MDISAFPLDGFDKYEHFHRHGNFDCPVPTVHFENDRGSVLVGSPHQYWLPVFQPSTSPSCQSKALLTSLQPLSGRDLKPKKRTWGVSGWISNSACNISLVISVLPPRFCPVGYLQLNRLYVRIAALLKQEALRRFLETFSSMEPMTGRGYQVANIRHLSQHFRSFVIRREIY